MRLPPRAVSVGDVRCSLGTPVANPVQTHRGRPPPRRGDPCRHHRGGGKSVSPGGRRAVAWLRHADPPVRRPRHPRPAQSAAVPGLGRPAPVAHAARRDLLRCPLDGQPGALPGGGATGHRRGHHRRRQRPAPALGRRAAAPRGRRCRDRRSATPVLGDQLDGGRLPRHAARRLQDGRHRPGAAADHAHRRGRRHRRVRRDAGRWPVRRLRPVRRRRSSATSSSPSCCSPPPGRSVSSCWSACRCSSAPSR